MTLRSIPDTPGQSTCTIVTLQIISELEMGIGDLPKRSASSMLPSRQRYSCPLFKRRTIFNDTLASFEAEGFSQHCEHQGTVRSIFRHPHVILVCKGRQDRALIRKQDRAYGLWSGWRSKISPVFVMTFITPGKDPLRQQFRVKC